MPAAPTRAGYTFANWNTAADGTGTAYAPAATFAMPAANSTLYAIWTINSYTVSFDSQGGIAVSSITQDFASTVTVPAAPTRTGYTFGNWNTAADGTGTAYAPAATFSMPANELDPVRAVEQHGADLGCSQRCGVERRRFARRCW